ncbi:MAG: integration host factor subunit alpha [Alphaproteobacteria bacterium]|jgi:integration host factor subunit alpha|nr:integration host factor subunit alpha [Alphaproteobacteria bacterium]MCV6599329.1 integration host factor subunit alpha [Alphaproteobacteria bacterium]
MPENTVTRMKLSEAVYQELGLSRNECADFVDDFFDIISSALSKGNNVKISGFGTFSLIQKAERIGRNPKTGEESVITPRRVVSFKASQHLKDMVNKK